MTDEEFEKQATGEIEIIGELDCMTACDEETHYVLPSEVYTALKWLAIMVLPPLSLLVQALGDIWNLEIMSPIALTIAAVGTFVGAIIGVSAATNYSFRSK